MKTALFFGLSLLKLCISFFFFFFLGSASCLFLFIYLFLRVLCSPDLMTATFIYSSFLRPTWNCVLLHVFYFSLFIWCFCSTPFIYFFLVVFRVLWSFCFMTANLEILFSIHRQWPLAKLKAQIAHFCWFYHLIWATWQSLFYGVRKILLRNLLWEEELAQLKSDVESIICAVMPQSSSM